MKLPSYEIVSKWGWRIIIAAIVLLGVNWALKQEWNVGKKSPVGEKIDPPAADSSATASSSELTALRKELAEMRAEKARQSPPAPVEVDKAGSKEAPPRPLNIRPPSGGMNVSVSRQAPRDITPPTAVRTVKKFNQVQIRTVGRTGPANDEEAFLQWLHGAGRDRANEIVNRQGKSKATAERELTEVLNRRFQCTGKIVVDTR